jgi:hypothetical protein
MMMGETAFWTLARAVAARYGALSEVEAVALGGSAAAGTADPGSDIDLYVYVREAIPVEVRARIASAGAEAVEVDNQFWEPGDEWIDAETGIHVDVMFRSVGWIEEQLDRVLQRHEASVGYSTCLWHNVVSSRELYDREEWFKGLQQRAHQPYPEELRRAVVAKNHPILRETASSYRYQLAGAVAREDLVSVNHRVAAVLASYFDILFALNRMPHPGEKRIVEIVLAQCAKVPGGMKEQVEALVAAVADGQGVVDRLDELVEELDQVLQVEGLL